MQNSVWEMGIANREMAKWHHINLGSLQGQTCAEKCFGAVKTPYIVGWV